MGKGEENGAVVPRYAGSSNVQIMYPSTRSSKACGKCHMSLMQSPTGSKGKRKGAWLVKA